MHVRVLADEVFLLIESHLFLLISDEDDPFFLCRRHKVLLELIDLFNELVANFLTIMLDKKFWEIFELLVE